jgi:hypothetical protein
MLAAAPRRAVAQGRQYATDSKVIAHAEQHGAPQSMQPNRAARVSLAQRQR